MNNADKKSVPFALWMHGKVMISLLIKAGMNRDIYKLGNNSNSLSLF